MVVVTIDNILIMKKIYVSLPISGYPLESRINEAQRVKRNLEYIQRDVKVVTPFDVNENEDKDSYARKMGNDIEALLECDEVHFCEGWCESKGCQLAFAAAKLYGKKITFDK